jgi:excisionase family DNA binding protein
MTKALPTGTIAMTTTTGGTMKNTTISPKEMARAKGCTLKYIYDLLAAERIPGAAKRGKIWRIPASALGRMAGQRESASQDQH